MFRAMLYGSYKKPRELLWVLGMGIYLCLMAEAFFPDSLLEGLAAKTMVHAASLLPPSRRLEVTPSDLCHFFAMVYCMGVVRLPCKKDYWRLDHDFWPLHPPAQNITRKMFMHIWRHLHFVGANTEQDEEEDVDDDSDEDEDEDEDGNDTEEEEEDEPEEDIAVE